MPFNYTKLTPAGKREMLEQSLLQMESQHFGRTLDVAHWKEVQNAPMEEAMEADARIGANQQQEAQQQLAGALYDLAKLELKIVQLEAELKKLGPPPKEAKKV